jgi:uncharacterized membrane protein YhaH (DUF805 family)
MKWSSPFSFNGKIGRAHLWLTLVVASVIGMISDLVFPVSEHKIVLSNFGGYGESSIRYATPVEPVTILSWITFGASCLIAILLFLAINAGVVKRLHDLGQSGKWVAFFYGTVVIVTALEVALPFLGIPRTIIDVATTFLFVPICIVSGVGMFMMLFLSGDSVPALPRWLRD